MHNDRKLTEDRITRVLRDRVRPAILGRREPCTVEAWQVPGEPVAPEIALAASYSPFKTGESWGPPWGTTWFHITARNNLSGRVDLLVDLGFRPEHGPGFQAEGLIYDAAGRPLQGLQPRNHRLRVEGDVDFYVEAASNPVIGNWTSFAATPLGDLATAGTEHQYRLAAVDLVVVHEEVEALAYDLEVLDGLMRALPPEDPRRHHILRTIEKALNSIDLQDLPGTGGAAREILRPALDSPANPSAHRISAIGHAHIDSAWLWPLRETVRKCARTFTNVAALADRHPELVFACSQAQQYAWMKTHHPHVFARIKEKVAAGQFLPVGGMWVESDTNLPGGEALVRQFVHGKRFFLDEFGIECEEVWLPDSFGYSAALPQIARLAGARWFLTQKMSWNQSNRFPHHTFWWEGLDGTRIFTHFPPVDTYNATLSPAELAHASDNFAEKGRATRSLVPFGFGDGGGGPTEAMLELARRQADLEGSPRVTIEAPSAFFRAAEAEYPHAPVWSGEMYLELHRATYTTQAKMKQGNRRGEHLLREAELWNATAAITLPGFAYPCDELDRIWKTVLLHQFHDILPGSSIAWVHREAAAAYERVCAELEEMIDSAQRALAGSGSDTVHFNGSSFARHGVPGLGASASRASAAGDPLRIEVDEQGHLVSIYDVEADREILPPGARANVLQLHQDLPNRWDAWDVDAFYRDCVVDVTGSFRNSRVTQKVELVPGERRIDFTTTVDWAETEKFLKVAFPLAIRADRSSSETQFGHVQRPTHTNTSWDAARFEICAHRWIHVGEAGYGIAIANDSTYGHDVTRDGNTTTVRLSLLRAPRFPDPQTDHGTHTFRYSLIVGADITDAIAAGHDLNLPIRSRPGSREVAPLITLDNPAVVVEAVKLAEDRSGDLIVRLYESLGGQAKARLTANFAHGGVTEVDLLERRIGDAAELIRLRPFQIITLRFRGPTRHR